MSYPYHFAKIASIDLFQIIVTPVICFNYFNYSIDLVGIRSCLSQQQQQQRQRLLVCLENETYSITEALCDMNETVN